MTFQEWREAYQLRSAIADRVSAMILARAKRVCREAGLDPGCIGVHPHNAMCGFHAGQPWSGVDYSKVRKCIWLLDRQFDAHRIVERWDRRVRSSVRHSS